MKGLQRCYLVLLVLHGGVLCSRFEQRATLSSLYSLAQLPLWHEEPELKSEASEHIEQFQKVLRPPLAFSYNEDHKNDLRSAASDDSGVEKIPDNQKYEVHEVKDGSNDEDYDTKQDLKKSGGGHGGGGHGGGGHGGGGHGGGGHGGGGHGGGGHGGEGHHKSGGGKAHHAEHHSKKGGKGDKGYEGYHESEKSEKGSHNKEGHKGSYSDEGGKKSSHFEDQGYSAEYHKGAKGEKGGKFEEDGKHGKGHSTKGGHTVSKKDHYEKKHEFFDESYEGGDSDKHGAYFSEDGYKKGGSKKGGHKDGAHHEEHYGKEKHHEKGGHHAEEKGHSNSAGHDSHHSHDSKYGKKDGKQEKHAWGYKKGSGGGGGHGHGGHGHGKNAKDTEDNSHHESVKHAHNEKIHAALEHEPEQKNRDDDRYGVSYDATNVEGLRVGHAVPVPSTNQENYDIVKDDEPEESNLQDQQYFHQRTLMEGGSENNNKMNDYIETYNEESRPIHIVVPNTAEGKNNIQAADALQSFIQYFDVNKKRNVQGVNDKTNTLRRIDVTQQNGEEKHL